MQDSDSDSNRSQPTNGSTGTINDYFDGDVKYPNYPNLDMLEIGSRSLESPPYAKVNLDVPFIHQLWDTAEGFNGIWACGAVSSAMVLAYYGLLTPHPIEISVPLAHSSDYGWYLTNVFEHNGHTFSATAKAPTNKAQTIIKDFPGIYGTVLDYHGADIGWATAAEDLRGNGKGIKPLMSHFLPQIGNTLKIHIDLRSKPRAKVESLITQTLDSQHPIIISTFLFGYHHLVVIKGYYQDEADGQLKWIVNDPYGYQTDGSYDGGNVVYEYNELKPKWMVCFSGPNVPAVKATKQHKPVRLFDKDSNEQIGEGTLIEGTDKVYIKKLFWEE